MDILELFIEHGADLDAVTNVRTLRYCNSVFCILNGFVLSSVTLPFFVLSHLVLYCFTCLILFDLILSVLLSRLFSSHFVFFQHNLIILFINGPCLI